MSTRYLKMMAIGLVLLFFFQGCSFYAGFSVSQSPQMNETKMATVQQEERAVNIK